MTKIEALQALSEGEMLTHEHFSKDEFVRLSRDGFNYEFEDGVKVHPKMFWQDRQGAGFENAWSIFSVSPQ